MKVYTRDKPLPLPSRRSSLRPVEGLVDGVLAAPRIRERLLQEKIFASWPQVVGVGLVDKCRPVKIKGKTIYLEVRSSAWAHQLIYLQEEVIKRVNKLAGKLLIANLHCRTVGKWQARESGLETSSHNYDPAAMLSSDELEDWRRQTQAVFGDNEELAELFFDLRRQLTGRQRWLEKKGR